MPDRPLRILLWAPRGAGHNYWGPGSSALRLIEKAPSHLSFDLVHAAQDQKKLEVFEKQTCLGNLAGENMLYLPGFLIRSYFWLKKNAAAYDFFYGLTPFHFTVQPALWAENFGLPATVKMTALRSGLSGGNRLNKWLKLPKKRQGMLKEISHVVSISDAITQELESYGFSPPQLVQIPNGVNIERFTPLEKPQEKYSLRQKLGLENRFTVLFVGGMCSRKQPIRNLEVIARLSQQTNKLLQAVFVGPEREKGYLKQFHAKVNELGLTEQVKWVDYCEKVEEFYQAADIFLLLSQNEGMANSLLEAMACGVPAFVTDISGSRDLLDDDRGGKCFETASTSEIVNTVKEVIDDRGKLESLSREARGKIVSRFSYDAIWDAYLEKCFLKTYNPKNKE